LVDKSLNDRRSAVRDGVDDGAVAVEVQDAGISAGGDEEAADGGVSADGGVVKGVAAVDVGLREGDTFLEADGDKRQPTGDGGLGKRTRVNRTQQHRGELERTS
jgi:hypothetical protein